MNLGGVGNMLGIGTMLRNAREEQGFSLEDMRRKTNIQVDYLRFLEEEKFDELPSPFYTRGFLRAYAKSLKLDAMYILQLYENSKKHPSSNPSQNRAISNQQAFSEASTAQAQQVTSSIPKVSASRFSSRRTNRRLSMSQIETFAPRRKVHRKRKKGIGWVGWWIIISLIVVLLLLLLYVYFSYK